LNQHLTLYAQKDIETNYLVNYYLQGNCYAMDVTINYHGCKF